MMETKIIESPEFAKAFARLLSKFKTYDYSYRIETLARKISEKDMNVLLEGTANMSSDDIQKLILSKPMATIVAGYKDTVVAGLKKGLVRGKKQRELDKKYLLQKKKQAAEQKARMLAAQSNTKDAFAKLYLTPEQRVVLKKILESQ